MFNFDIATLEQISLVLRLIAFVAVFAGLILCWRIYFHLNHSDSKESFIRQNKLNNYRIFASGVACLFSAFAVLAGLLLLFLAPSFDFIYLFNVAIYLAIAIGSASAFHLAHETKNSLETLIDLRSKIDKL